MTVSEWSDAHRIISARKGNPEPGQWRTSRTPYLREIMDAMGDPGLEEVVLVKPSQVGGTEATRNAMGFWIDQDPGPMLVVYPTQAAAEEQIRDRIVPLITDTPRLAAHLPGKRGDTTSYALDLDTMPVWIGWAGSPQALASRPCRRVIFDEVDKFPPFSGAESDPLALGRARTRTFGHRRFHVLISTPTTDKGAIWKAFESCKSQRHYWVPCPSCGSFQPLDWSRIRWPGHPEVVDPAIIDEQGVTYSCAHCPAMVPESAKPTMIDRGVWVSDGFQPGEHPPSKKRGYKLNALAATIGSRWRDLAAKWQGVKADPAQLMEFVNQELGDPFRDQVAKVRDTIIQSRMKHGPERGVVPEWASTVVITADTQKDRFYWLARAWGRGERSQLIDIGLATSFDELAAILEKRYPIKDSAEKLRPLFIGIDVGGGTRTETDGNRTDEVYRWAAKDPARRVCLKGWGGKGRAPRDVSDSYHTYKRKGAGYDAYRVRLVTIDTQHFKDVVCARVNFEPEVGQDSIWTMCGELPDQYFDHMRAEHKVRVRSGSHYEERWVARSHGRRNDYWDCEVYQAACARLFNAVALPSEETVKQAREAVVQTRTQAQQTTLPTPTRFSPSDGRAYLACRREPR